LPPLLPSPAPPLGGVEVVPELVLLVAEVVVVDVGVLLVLVLVVGVVVVLVVGVVEVLVVVVVVVVVGVLEAVVSEVLLALVLWHSLAASWLTVCAPWPRFCTSVVFTVEGRFATPLLNERAALAATPQLPAATAEDSAASWLLRLLAWSLESRPLLPPQATRNDTAKPIPPARIARDP
jgi:hypothetical protein